MLLPDVCIEAGIVISLFIRECVVGPLCLLGEQRGQAWDESHRAPTFSTSVMPLSVQIQKQMQEIGIGCKNRVLFYLQMWQGVGSLCTSGGVSSVDQ